MAKQAPITVHIHAEEVAAADLPLYLDTMARALRFTTGDSVQGVAVYVNPRGVYASEPDWLEYALVVTYTDPARAPFRVGAIQRQPGAASEFHS